MNIHQWPFQEPIDWRYLPYIRPIFRAYGNIPHKMWPEKWYLTYLHFRVLKIQLIHYPLVNCPIAMEHHHCLAGKIHYFYVHFFNSKLFVYQRVYPIIIPLFTIVNPLLPHCFPIKSPFNHHSITISSGYVHPLTSINLRYISHHLSSKKLKRFITTKPSKQLMMKRTWDGPGIDG